MDRPLRHRLSTSHRRSAGGLQPRLLLVAGSAAGLIAVALGLQQLLTPRHPAAAALSGPPQVLPITAELCIAPPDGAPAAAAGGDPAGTVCFAVEQPRTPQQYAWGLQQRPELPRRRGMWFAYNPPAPAWFWMHRTLHPLDLIFVSDGRVLKIERAVPTCSRLPCPVYGTSVPLDGVLEIRAGDADALGLRIGGRISLRPLPASR
ncbi:MAG: DUF192 domain-containing protein [Synechococcaceae cyanobacterium]|nr:DUF192 domain-containing protein [Synechococcaceae cyanobacterium]